MLAVGVPRWLSTPCLHAGVRILKIHHGGPVSRPSVTQTPEAPPRGRRLGYNLKLDQHGIESQRAIAEHVDGRWDRRTHPTTAPMCVACAMESQRAGRRVNGESGSLALEGGPEIDVL